MAAAAMKDMTALIINGIVSRILTIALLVVGVVAGHFLAQALGKGRWESLTMFCPAVLFALWAWLRYRLSQRIAVGTLICSGLFLTFGIIVLWRG